MFQTLSPKKYEQLCEYVLVCVCMCVCACMHHASLSIVQSAKLIHSLSLCAV
jgi:hypothetical protein